MDERINIISIGDFGKQADDECALLMLATQFRTARLAAVIGNYTAAANRARLADSMLTALGLSDIPVGVGLDPKPDDFQDYEFKTHYPITSRPLLAAHEVIGRALEAAADQSITLLLHSSLRDAAEILQHERALCARKIGQVVIQAGVRIKSTGEPQLVRGMVQPDDSYNAACDPEAAQFVYEAVQQLGIATTYVSRYAARQGGAIPTLHLNEYDWMHPVGASIKRRAFDAADAYWQAVHTEPGSDKCELLHTNATREDYINFLLGGKDPEIGASESIYSHLEHFVDYDSIAAAACQHELSNQYFEPYIVQGRAAAQRIIGLNPQETNIKRPKFFHVNLWAEHIAVLNSAEISHSLAQFIEPFNDDYLRQWAQRPNHLVPWGNDYRLTVC